MTAMYSGAGFGEKNLEKTPLKEVAHEPHHLLDRLRHQRTTKALEPAKESKIEELLQKFAVDCRIKGIQVRLRNPFWGFSM